MRDPAHSIAAFDSAPATVRLLAAALRGQDLPRLGQPRIAAAAVRTTSVLPPPLRRRAYARAGALEAVPAESLGSIDLQAVATYLAGSFPSRRYPAVLVGAANGGMTHVAAAAQIPFLPQTVLVPVRWSGNEPDRPDRALAWGARVADPLLAANPQVELHHMHDRIQDELMVGHIAYFRCKWMMLPAAYRRALRQWLSPGAPIMLVRGDVRWPVTRVADRHVFQNGAYGGLDPDDYQRHRHAPTPDGTDAEAEWGTTTGFADALREWAATHQHPLVESPATTRRCWQTVPPTPRCGGARNPA